MIFDYMKNLHFICLLILMSFCGIKADAQSADSSKVNFVYDVKFDMDFDNREFARNRFSPSMTIFGARLTPVVGLQLKERNGAHHRLMAGVDVMKDFGASPVSELIAGGKTAETDLKLNNLKLFQQSIQITADGIVNGNRAKTSSDNHNNRFAGVET